MKNIDLITELAYIFHYSKYYIPHMYLRMVLTPCEPLLGGSKRKIIYADHVTITERREKICTGDRG